MTCLLATLLLAGCGARLNDEQYSLATRSGQGGGASALGTGGLPGVDGATAGPGGEAAGPTAGDPAAGGGGGGGASAGGAAGGGGGAAGPAGAKAPPCTPNTTGPFGPGLTAKDVTTGNVSTVSGPVSGLFAGARDGTNAFYAYQNSIGGVCGRQLKQLFADDGLDASSNKRQYEALVPKVFGFVGSFSVVDEGGAQVLKETGVPDAAYALSTIRFNLPNNFSPQPLPRGWPSGPLQYYKDKFGDQAIKKVVLLIQNAQSAKDAAAGLKGAAQQLGYEFICERIVEPTETSFDGDANCAKRQGAKGIFVTGEASAMGRIAASFAQQGLRPGPDFPIAAYGGNAYDPKFLAAAGAAAEGAVIHHSLSLYAGEDSFNPEVVLFNKWYRQVTNGKTPDIFAAYGWASARLFVQALQAAGPLPTRDSLLAALKTIDDFDSNGLLAKVGPASKRPAVCYLIITVKGGKFARHPDDPPNAMRCDGQFIRVG